MNKLQRILTSSAIVIALSGCATTAQSLDPDALWQRADRQHARTIAAVARRQQLQSDYATVIRLSRDGDLRGQAFMRLAELNVSLEQYEEARLNLEQSLRAELSPEHQRQVLLMLGDLLERHLLDRTTAATAYRQLINEHPATPEAELGSLRLRVLGHVR